MTAAADLEAAAWAGAGPGGGGYYKGLDSANRDNVCLRTVVANRGGEGARK
jgi:hypothetical protein